MNAEEGADTNAPWWQGAWGRLGITIALLAFLELLAHVHVPGVSPNIPGALGVDVNTRTAPNSILAFGVRPFLGAAVLVEVAARVVPAWRHLRHGNASDRAKLTRTALWLTLLFAVVQSYTAWLFVTRTWSLHGIGPMFAVILTWTAGVFIMLAVAALITRYGIANGFGVLLLLQLRVLVDRGGVLPDDPSLGRFFQDSLDIHQLGMLAAMVISMLATALILWVNRRARSRSTYVAGPVAGLNPLLFLSAPASLAPLLTSEAPVLTHPLIGLATVLLGAVVLASLFHPAATMRLWRQRIDKPEAVDRRTSLYPAIAEGAAYVALLFGIMSLLLPTGLELILLSALATALLFDSVVEWRARRADSSWTAVWPLHHCDAADLVRQQLAAADIPVFVRTLSQRRLWHFFAPYLPMDVMVPAAQADAARAILEPLLAPATAASRDNVNAAAPPSPSGSRGWALAAARRVSPLLAPALGLLGTYFGFMAMQPPAPPAGPPAVFQISLVADDVDPLADLDPLTLPAGVEKQLSTVSVGPGRQISRVHLAAYLQPGEELSALRERLQPWLATIATPPNTRIALQTLHELDPAAPQRPIGLRTYLLQEPAALTGAAIECAGRRRRGIGCLCYAAVHRAGRAAV